MSMFIGYNDDAKGIKEIYIGVNGISQRIISGYIGDINGISKLFYDNHKEIEITYSGTHIVEIIEFDNMKWQQWTFISSGILRVANGTPPLSKIWLCSGGGNGTNCNDKRGGVDKYGCIYWG